MRSSSSLKLSASAIFAGAMFLGLYACSSSSDSSAQLPDGAIIGTDGAVITDPDAIAAGDGAEGAPSSLVNVTTATLTVAGDTRTYLLSVPKTYSTSKSYPLIIALHGDGETADGFRQYLGFDAITGNDAITAYPEISADGNDPDLYTDYDSNGDQLLVAATIQDVQSKYNNIDTSKVWGFGYSKGGYMLNHLQCVHPGLFTAFAAHATGGPLDENGTQLPCMAETTTRILDTEGNMDDVGARGAADYWAMQNGCAADQTPIAPTDCYAYNTCPSGKQVQYCLVPGLMHSPIWNQATTVSWAFYQSN